MAESRTRLPDIVRRKRWFCNKEKPKHTNRISWRGSLWTTQNRDTSKIDMVRRIILVSCPSIASLNALDCHRPVRICNGISLNIRSRPIERWYFKCVKKKSNNVNTSNLHSLKDTNFLKCQMRTQKRHVIRLLLRTFLIAFGSRIIIIITCVIFFIWKK